MDVETDLRFTLFRLLAIQPDSAMLIVITTIPKGRKKNNDEITGGGGGISRIAMLQFGIPA